MKTFIKSALVAATILAPVAMVSTDASAVKLPKVYIATCEKTFLQIPNTVALSCKGTSKFIGNLVWQTWTLTSATATGVYHNGAATTSGTYTFSGTASKKGKTYFTHVSGAGLASTTLVHP